MGKRYRFSVIWCVAFALLILVGSSSYAAEQPKVYCDPWNLDQYITGDKTPPDNLVILFKMASVAPEGSAWVDYAEKTIWPEITKKSNGLIRIKLYGGGVMGDEADTIRKVKMKQLHIVGVTAMGLSVMVPELSILKLPFLVDWEPDLYYGLKYNETDWILRKLGPEFAKYAAEKDFQYVGSLENSWSRIGSKAPVTKVEDFKKLSFPIWRGDRVRPRLNEVFGFYKTPSGQLYDVAQLLSTGMADSWVVAWYPAVVLQWWPHYKYVTDYPVYGYESATVFGDKRAFAKVSAFMDKWGSKYGVKNGKEWKKEFLTITDVGMEKMRLKTRKAEIDARKALVIDRKAIKELHFEDAELEKLRAKCEPLQKEFVGKLYPESLLNEILQYRAEYRALEKQGKLAEFHQTGILPEGYEKGCNDWVNW